MRHLVNEFCKAASASLRCTPLKSGARRVELVRNYSYEGDGKMNVKFLNKEPDMGILIEGYSTVGFRLSNGLSIIGPMAIFPRSILSWKVKTFTEVTADALSLFTILEPKIDILVLGVGEMDCSRRQSLERFASIRKLGINLEVLSTDQACAIYNFLSAEGRNVAAAIIPPATLRFNENDLMRSKITYGNLTM